MFCAAAVSLGGIAVRQSARTPTINESNIESLSASEFQRQLTLHELLPRDDCFQTFFTPWPESPTAAARFESGGGMTDEEVLAEVGRIDVSPEAHGSGPHVECITHEGTLKSQKPIIHSVQAFRNRFIDLWLLREKAYRERKWRTYVLAQDKTVEPNVARYFQLAFDGSGKWVARGATCYECHSSGPRAMRGIRADLISGRHYADEMNDYIRSQDFVETRFSESEPQAEYGESLHVAACTGCHSIDGQRGPLYSYHRRSIGALIRKANMPPDETLSPAELRAIAEWLGPAGTP